jgi:hypothetical protein
MCSNHFFQPLLPGSPCSSLDLDREEKQSNNGGEKEQPSDKKKGKEVLQETLLPIGDAKVRSLNSLT